MELPDFQERAHGQSIAGDRQPHRLAEVAEVGVDVVLVRPQHDQLAGLVGGHQQRDAELIEEGGEVGGMDAAERRRRAVSAAAGGPLVPSLRSAGWADASAHPRHATWRESDITPLLLQDLMTSPSSADGSLGPG